MFNDFVELFRLIRTIFFDYYGWVFFVYALGQMFYLLYMDYIQLRWYSTLEWNFVKVAVPRENEKSPITFEHILNQMHSVHGHLTPAEKYLEGEFHIWFVWEVTSIGGEIGNYVRVLKKHRDLLEAAVYSQFPEAEITDVPDYFESLPKYHTDTSSFDIFAFSFRYVKAPYYPMRTYYDFEHAAAETIVDPITGMWEELGKLSPYEMYIVQFVLRPISDEEWKEEGRELVQKLKGVPQKHKRNLLLAVLNAVFGTIIDEVFIRPETEHPRPPKEQPPSLMLHLSEGEKDVINAVEKKMGRWGYQTKIHCLYIAPREKYNPGVINGAVVGAFKAYGSGNINALKPLLRRWTKVHYWVLQKWEKPIVELRLKFRKRKYMRLIRTRWYFHGPPPNIMSTEEIASVLHFPQIEVTVPNIAKVAVAKVQPPPELPVAEP
ncbi:MAG: hypothetical protein HY398_01380 [Candidatus Doudnabacteria bacterium]|nr:hypothetical protein [Candidatus Doudnabacteria bacterium]